MKRAWYKEGAVYQVYPRSFKDTNNDGIGDLKGIIEKIEYIASLGVKMVWLSPIYASPLEDNGYDISDYKAIHPDYGTMDDFKHMIDLMHQKGLKLIMDLVVNHTSSEHHWFKEARSSKDNPYHDYYHWKEKPNNWTSFFGGPAWDYNEATNEYYLHLFAKNQPDLNWENQAVREEVKSILRFWLDLGVDGFRCDVINILSKNHGLPNGKGALILVGKEHYMNGERIHDYLQELKKDVFDHYDCFTVGESVFVNCENALDYIEDEKELNMLFQFDHMAADNYFVKWFLRKFKPLRLKQALYRWQKAINGRGWNTLYLENHDQPRSLSRFGNEAYPFQSASMLAVFLLFQQGTPFIYQGQEIGMRNADFTSLDEYKDVETHTIYRIGRKFFSHRRMMKKIKHMSRDNARTPMQWDDSLYAGFSHHEPWLGVNQNYKEINVKQQLNTPQSLFYFYQKILKIRQEDDTVVYGDFIEHDNQHPTIIYYERNLDNKQLVVICNYSDQPQTIQLKHDLSQYDIILHNYEDQTNDLRPYEAIVYRRKSK